MTDWGAHSVAVIMTIRSSTPGADAGLVPIQQHRIAVIVVDEAAGRETAVQQGKRRGPQRLHHVLGLPDDLAKRAQDLRRAGNQRRPFVATNRPKAFAAA